MEEKRKIDEYVAINQCTLKQLIGKRRNSKKSWTIPKNR